MNTRILLNSSYSTYSFFNVAIESWEKITLQYDVPDPLWVTLSASEMTCCNSWKTYMHIQLRYVKHLHTPTLGSKEVRQHRNQQPIREEKVRAWPCKQSKWDPVRKKVWFLWEKDSGLMTYFFLLLNKQSIYLFSNCLEGNEWANLFDFWCSLVSYLCLHFYILNKSESSQLVCNLKFLFVLCFG